MHLPAFGYIRLPVGASEQSTQDLRSDLTDYAERQGYTLAEVFAEQEASGSSAFAALIDALKRSRTSIVVVPSLATLPIFLDCVLQCGTSSSKKQALVLS